MAEDLALQSPDELATDHWTTGVRLYQTALAKRYIQGTAGELASQFSYQELTPEIAQYLDSVLAGVGLSAKPSLAECTPETKVKVSLRGGKPSPERFYPGSPDRVYKAALRAVADLQYSITNSDASSRTVSFNTGMSMSSFAGQNMTMSVFEEGERHSRVVGSGRREQRGNPFSGGGQIYDWGEKGQILRRFFNAMDLAFVATPEPAPTAAEPVASQTAELERLAELSEKGMLTDDEFRAAKAKLLD